MLRIPITVVHAGQVSAYTTPHSSGVPRGVRGVRTPIDVAKKLLLCQKCVKMQYFHPKILKKVSGEGAQLDPSTPPMLKSWVRHCRIFLSFSELYHLFLHVVHV